MPGAGDGGGSEIATVSQGQQSEHKSTLNGYRWRFMAGKCLENYNYDLQFVDDFWLFSIKKATMTEECKG